MLLEYLVSIHSLVELVLLLEPPWNPATSTCQRVKRDTRGTDQVYKAASKRTLHRFCIISIGPPSLSLSGKCVLGVVNLKGFTATALFLCFCFSFLHARPAVAVRIKRDKSIGGWTLGPRVVLPPSLFRPIGPILECAFIGETKWTNR